MKPRVFCPLLALSLLISAPALPAGTFHELFVAPTGSDTNRGTKAKPFQTITRAREVVRDLKYHRMGGDIIVNLRGGNYPLTAPIEFTAADSGRNGWKIIYRAWKNETPVLNGGVLVTNWTRDHGNIFKATLNRDEKLRSLFVNGQRAVMTQRDFKGQGAWGEFVVTGSEPWAETPGKTLDGIQFSAREIPALANPADVELLQHRTWNFIVLGLRDIVTEGSNTVVKLQQPYGAIAATMAWGCSLSPAKMFTLRNAYEFLDTPGQFYFNRATHTLYYFARAEDDMSRAEVIAPMSEGLLRVTGISKNARVQNLEFSGITFAYDHWLLQDVAGSRGMIGVQSLGLYTKFRADGNWHKSHYNICDVPQATVELRNAASISFTRNKFEHLASGCAVNLINDVVDSTVEGNIFNDISGNAVNLGHPQHYLIGDGPLFANADKMDPTQTFSSLSSPKGGGGRGEEADIVGNLKTNDALKIKIPSPQPSPRLGGAREPATSNPDRARPNLVEGVCARDRVANNFIRRVSLDYKQGEAISGFFTEAASIVHNDIAGVPYGGIALGWWWGNAEIPASTVPRDNVIAFNKVTDTQQELPKDGGSIYVLGEQPGSLIVSNYVRANTRLLYADDGSAYWKIANNVTEGNTNAQWLFLWVDRIHDLRIENNFTTTTNLQNKATNNCTPLGTQLVKTPFTGAAKKIADAAGLEKPFRNLAKP